MAGDLERSVADYGRISAEYDHATRRINGVRRDAVAALRLQNFAVHVRWPPGWRYIATGTLR